MSSMNAEIVKAMNPCEPGEPGMLSASFVFPAEFSGFRGHFEDNPVLPGVCKIQAVIAMWSRHLQKNIRLKEIVLAKYLLPVTCGQEITIESRTDTHEGPIRHVQAVVKKGSEKISMLKLILEETL